MEMTLPDPPSGGTIPGGHFDFLYEGTGSFTLGSSPAVSGYASIFNRGDPGGPGGFGALLLTVGPLQLLFESFGGVPAPLTTLIEFPDKASVFSYLAGSMVASERGGLPGGVSFNIDTFSLALAPVGTVPIPAALPLFASAMAGLGFVGWRRRKQANTQVPSETGGLS